MSEVDRGELNGPRPVGLVVRDGARPDTYLCVCATGAGGVILAHYQHPAVRVVPLGRSRGRQLAQKRLRLPHVESIRLLERAGVCETEVFELEFGRVGDKRDPKVRNIVAVAVCCGACRRVDVSQAPDKGFVEVLDQEVDPSRGQVGNRERCRLVRTGAGHTVSSPGVQGGNGYWVRDLQNPGSAGRGRGLRLQQGVKGLAALGNARILGYTGLAMGLSGDIIINGCCGCSIIRHTNTNRVSLIVGTSRTLIDPRSIVARDLCPHVIPPEIIGAIQGETRSVET